MARTPSRPGFLIAGAVVFALLPFIFSMWTGQPFSMTWCAVGLVISVLFLYLAYGSHRRHQTMTGRPEV